MSLYKEGFVNGFASLPLIRSALNARGVESAQQTIGRYTDIVMTLLGYLSVLLGLMGAITYGQALFDSVFYIPLIMRVAGKSCFCFLGFYTGICMSSRKGSAPFFAIITLLACCVSFVLQITSFIFLSMFAGLVSLLITASISLVVVRNREYFNRQPEKLLK